MQIWTQGGEAAKSLMAEMDIDNGTAYHVFDSVNNTHVSQPPIDQVIRVTRAPPSTQSTSQPPPPLLLFPLPPDDEDVEMATPDDEDMKINTN